VSELGDSLAVLRDTIAELRAGVARQESVPAEGDDCTNWDPKNPHPNEAARLACWHVHLFGDGAVSGVVSGSDESAPPSGAIGLELEKPTYSLVALVNVASGTDTLVSQFGESALPRATGGAFDAALVQFRWHELFSNVTSGLWDGFPDNFGVYMYATGSTRTWSLWQVTTVIDDTVDPPVSSVDSSRVAYDVPIVGGGIGLYREFINHSIGSTDVSLLLDAGLVHRQLAGELRNDDAKQLLVSNLGSDDTNYNGVELGMELIVNNLKAEFYYLNFFDGDSPVRGLSKGNIVARFSIRGNLFRQGEWIDAR
jgi:hypothetical protein